MPATKAEAYPQRRENAGQRAFAGEIRSDRARRQSAGAPDSAGAFAKRIRDRYACRAPAQLGKCAKELRITPAAIAWRNPAADGHGAGDCSAGGAKAAHGISPSRIFRYGARN